MCNAKWLGWATRVGHNGFNALNHKMVVEVVEFLETQKPLKKPKLKTSGLGWARFHPINFQVSQVRHGKTRKFWVR